MEKCSILYNKIINDSPFCFVKMNDGECSIMNNPSEKTIVSRGDQQGSELLSNKLKEVLKYQHPNYYVGLPCNSCYNFNLNIDTEDKSSLNYLNANILINSNVNKTIDVLSSHLKNKYVVVVTNNLMIGNINKLKLLNISVEKTIQISDKNAFDNDYERIKDSWQTLPNSAFIIFLCGPIGRVLAYEWFKQNTSFTCLELGSLFDPLLKNRSYSYHQNTLRLCSECNPTKLDERAFNSIIPDYTQLQTECYYFNNLNDYLNFYNNDIVQIEDVLVFRSSKNEQNAVIMLKELNEYVKNINKEPSNEINKYKNNNKQQLYNLCLNLYNTKNLIELDKCCELYLSYFSELDEEEVRKVKFWYGFANFSLNKEKAVKVFEELYSCKNIEEDTKKFTGYNLDMLYPKISGGIPKIIHFIYLGGRPICNYHYRCIMSAILYMPSDYRILIHCSEEPVDNDYWNQIKTISRVEIVKVIAPEEFDGFKLTYIQYKADILRLTILYEYGGIYLDTDMLIIKNFEELFLSNKDFYISRETSDGGLINSFLATKPKNEFIKLWLEGFKSGLRMNNWAYHIRETNKIMLDKNPHYMIKYNIQILPYHHFFPVHWTERSVFESKEIYKFKEDTYGCHLWDTILGHVLSKNEFFPQPDHL